MWDHDTLYADRSSKDGQLLTLPLLWKTKNTNVQNGCKLQFILSFYGDTFWGVALIQIKFGIVKGHSYIYIILFEEAFKYGDSAKFWGYVGTTDGPLCVAFCNFVCNVTSL
jgi:hypothetical protein